jgi:hypothetical protein
MATASATVTAKSGPAIQNTAVALPNITRIDTDYARSVITVYYGSNQIGYYELVGVTTFSDTITGTNNVIVIS